MPRDLEFSGDVEISNSLSWSRLTPLEKGNSEDSVEFELGADSDEDRLPVTGSRNGKWWYSTYHNVTAMVGAGVLALPTSMAYLGWGGGTVVLVLSWVITLYTLWQMVEMHEMPDIVPGKRFDRYHELGQQAFGKKLGLWIVLPQQLVVEVGGGIVYMITGGQSLWQVHKILACKSFPAGVAPEDQCCGGIGQASFILMFAAPQFFLSQLGNFNSIASISLAASVMSLCYCTIAWADSIKVGNSNHSDGRSPSPSPAPNPVRYDDYGRPDTTPANLVFGAFSALGTIAFAYAGHNVVLEIQATLPSTRKKASKILMWRGVMVAYIAVAICYFPVAFAGYWAYGNVLTTRSDPAGGNILIRLETPKKLIAAANLMVAVHVTGSYQVYSMPVFDMMETVLVRKFHFPPLQPLSMRRIVTRSSYVLFTAFIACSLPFFHDVLGFLGGFAFAPTTYFLPCILWLIIKKPPAYSISWFLNWFLIVIGVLLSFIATIGGMRNIIVSATSRASSYDNFYSFTC